MREQGVIIIEDDLVDFHVLKKIINELNYNIRMCHFSFGSDVLSFLKQDKDNWNIIFVDYTLPDMSSFAVAEVIRRDFKFIKTVLLTGFYRGVQQLDNGILFDYYLSKDVTYERLKLNIMAILIEVFGSRSVLKNKREVANSI